MTAVCLHVVIPLCRPACFVNKHVTYNGRYVPARALQLHDAVNSEGAPEHSGVVTSRSGPPTGTHSRLTPRGREATVGMYVQTSLRCALRAPTYDR